MKKRTFISKTTAVLLSLSVAAGNLALDPSTSLGATRHGSLTLCFPLDFHNPLQHSPLRLIFLSIFCFFSVLFCTLVI